MPEVRPIDANWLKSWAKSECNPCGNPTIGLYDGLRFIEQIDKMPTIEPEVRHGRWIQTKLKGYYECSACGYEHTSNPDQRFCSYCGARMDGGADNAIT